MTEPTKHKWKFFLAGGFDQVRLETGADLAHLEQLDQKLWVALACPTRGIEFDTKTLDLIDVDKDGRIRVPEIIAATKWACGMVKNPDELTKGSALLALDAINDSEPEGKLLLAAARRILQRIGKTGAAVISVEDTADLSKIFAESRFNGDGVVTAASAAAPETWTLINDIIDCLGGVDDRSGAAGITADKIAQFFTEAQAYCDWWQTAIEKPSAFLPLGEDTIAAAAAFTAVKAKIDDYFARCRLAAFDARALAALNRQQEDYLAVAAQNMTITGEEIADFPLARIEADRPLPLTGGLNPAWAGKVAEFATAAKPLLGGKEELSFGEWTAIRAKFAVVDGWLAAKAGAAVEKLGLERLRAILAGHDRATIEALIAEDLRQEPEAAAIAQVDKLVRLNRDLCRLLRNFVSFHDFYGRKEKAVFQAGTLFLDGRSCDLCTTVVDAGKHAALAALAKTYLAYCDCTRPAGDKMQIAAAFTGGDADNLMIGRNGVFYDRQGRDWDATITKIVDNPISIRQAFWAPYKKGLRLIEEQLAKRAASADAAATARLQAAAAHVDTTLPPAPPTPPPPPKKVDPGMLAAIGLVLATLLAALGGIFAAFVKLPVWQMPLAILAILLAISIPSMVIAWLKLRQRNLGPILDANGWAVNARAKINVPLGNSLTKVAVLPVNAERSLTDPYAAKKNPWPWIIGLVILLAVAGGLVNHLGYLHQWTGWGKTVVEAPAAAQAPK